MIEGRVKDKIALITGASSGMGKADAILLAKEGAKVFLTDIDEVNGQKVADEINELNLNITDDRELEKIKSKVMVTYNRRGMMPALKYACRYFDEMNINVYKLANTPTLYDLRKSRYLSDDEFKFNEEDEYQFRATEDWMEDQDWQIWQSGEE